ncbi:hypothetical protein JCM6882_003005 [Rhodosporidiobolus microsporus]
MPGKQTVRRVDLLSLVSSLPADLRDPTVETAVSSTSSRQPGGRAATSSSHSSSSRSPATTKEQQQQQQFDTGMQSPHAATSTMTNEELLLSLAALPLPASATAPGSPLFGAGEGDSGLVGAGAGAMGAGEGQGESGVVGALGGLGGGFASNEGEKGEDYSALFNDLLSSNGLSHLITDAPIPAFSPSGNTNGGFGLPPLPTTTTTTSSASVPTSAFAAAGAADPRARHYALDAQLGSPMYDYSGSGGDYGDYGDFDAAFSPASLTGGGSPFFASSSGEASPAWGGGDDWSGSPAANAMGSTNVSPALGELDLFGEYNSSTDSGLLGAGIVDGASSTGASYPPLPPHYAGQQLFSPVVPAHAVPVPTVPVPAVSLPGALTPVLSDNDDADVPPQLLPPPLPVLAAIKTEDADVDLPAAAEPDSLSSPSSPEPTTKALDDPSSDDDYVPSTSSAAPAAPKRSTRRASTNTKKRTTSSSASPAPGVLPGMKVALDAPVTQRAYAVESRTSAKPIPKSLQKKMDAARRRGEEVDEQSFVDEATRKRKANTLSARESRAKKARYVAEVERELEDLRGREREWEVEREGWRKRVGELEGELERERKRARRA